MESDASRFDRQQVREMIDAEFLIRKKIGLNESLALMMRKAQDKWNYRGQGFKGKLDAQRLTGIWSTAFGNAIV